MTQRIDRGEFTTLAAARFAAKPFGQSSALTAGEVLERINSNLGVPWRGGPTDAFQAGDPFWRR